MKKHRKVRLLPKNLPFWFFSAIYQLLSRYRKSFLGPAWVLLGPTIMVLALGFIYSAISSVEKNIFIPHLTLGLTIWGLMTSLINQGAAIFTSKRGNILAGIACEDIIIIHVLVCLLTFMHMLILIFAVWLVYPWQLTSYTFFSIVGLMVIIINGYFVSWFLGFLSLFIKDIPPLCNALTGALFFVTPIIWMPSGTKAENLSLFLKYNPLFHYLEIIRAPALGNPIDSLSWYWVISCSVFLGLSTAIIKIKFSKEITKWL
jgi:ABC-type polysaccharide/polyol phosphate export permease